MHYNTWPAIVQDAGAFAARAAQSDHIVRVMPPGATLEF
jgi:hypothetical protein